ncbi:MAG: hypothetical protein FDZ69_12175 [Deltaproteobacteria bacterium]|nr:MAG: hypothetical protein FDZ69_12175 [Deltaproteobacteria bacterium]
MNTIRTLTLTLALALVSSAPALAVDTTKTYSSGLLIGIFLAFCALIVVVQLAPSLMLLFGFVKGLLRRRDSSAEVQPAANPHP